MKEAGIELDGVVSEALPSAMFRVDLDNGHRILATTGWQDAQVSHSRPDRRSRESHGLAVRSDARADHVPSQRVEEAR